MDDIDLTGRVALVTGASGGIGSAIMEIFLAKGAFCAGVDIAAGRRYTGRHADRVQLWDGDVANDSDVRRFVGEVMSAYGRIDILINNAGVFPRKEWRSIHEEEWDEVIATNLKGAFLLSKAIAPLMMARRYGKIVNMGSDCVFRGSRSGLHYVSSKAGLIGLTRALAKDLAQHQICVNLVAPGVTRTAQPGLSERDFAALGDRIPWKRVAEPADVARTVLFFASPLSDYVTGQILGVNGGDLFF